MAGFQPVNHKRVNTNKTHRNKLKHRRDSGKGSTSRLTILKPREKRGAKKTKQIQRRIQHLKRDEEIKKQGLTVEHAVAMMVEK